MAGDGSFLVEDFLGAITSQLDRTQDALVVKAVNRPLTYAIKDFSLDLKVFVDLDPEGRVRFRSPGADEPGASTVKIGFTTITRPMIEENTVDMSAARAPSLAQAGLSPAEAQRLERMGVRNTADLARLRQQAGTEGVSRLTEIPAERLRQALTLGRPQVGAVRPEPPRPPAATTPPSVAPTPPPRSPAPPAPVATKPEPKPVPVPAMPVLPRPRPVIVPPGTRRLAVHGRNLLAPGGPPAVRLGGRPLSVAEADDGRVVVELPDRHDALGGTLEIDYGDGEAPTTVELRTPDPWMPVHG